MKKYKFWSIYFKPKADPGVDNAGHWACIPPSKKYIPDWYPENALVKKHDEELLPPPSYWLDPIYEKMVYDGNYL